MSQASIEELRETVQRMEQRFGSRSDQLTPDLMRLYGRLTQRFRRDLGDERDELLSRGAALMFIQELLRERGNETIER